MLHLVKPAEGDGLDILVSATAVPVDDERLRLAAVMRYEILDTAPEAACDRITALVRSLPSVYQLLPTYTCCESQQMISPPSFCFSRPSSWM